VTWTRRDFVVASLAGMAAGALPRPLAGLLRQGPGLRELRRGVGIYVARGGTIGYLVNAAGTLVVDSQFPEQAGHLLDTLRERAALPLDALVNTHHHGDHTGGNGVLGPAARCIVAHERVPALQRAAAGANAPPQTFADTTFAAEWTAEIGDERVRLRHYGPAHTGGDCTAAFERADVVHVGDLVFHGAYPFVDRAGGASMRGWVSALEAIAADHPADTLYIFGHAAPGLPVTGSRADVLAQRDLLSAVLEAARAAHARGLAREEAIARDRLPGFEHVVPLSERLTLATTLAAAYDELAERPD
jgi:cyclase